MTNMGNRGAIKPATGSRAGNQAEHHEGLTTGLTEAAGQVKEKVQDFASDAANRLSEAWDATRTGAEDVFEDVASFVRRYPVVVAAAAFGLGFLVARVLSNWPMDMTRRMSQAQYQG